MPTKQKQDFEIWAGKRHDLYITIYDRDGAVQDISGAIFNWVLTTQRGAGTVLLTKTIAGGGITVSSTTVAPQIIVHIAAGDTSALNGTYYHELELMDSTSYPTNVAVGKVTINGSLS